MRRLVLILLCASALGACAITSYGTGPQAVENEPDTYRFRIFPEASVLEGAVADRVADKEIGKFGAVNGYASSRIVSRDSRGSAFVYTVKFTR